MKKAGRTPEEAAEARKGAPWKVALAAAMRRKTTASNRWLAEALHMGSGNAVGEYLSRVKAGKLKILEVEALYLEQ